MRDIIDLSKKYKDEDEVALYFYVMKNHGTFFDETIFQSFLEDNESESCYDDGELITSAG